MWTYRAQVTRVVDGDTIDVLVDLGFGVLRKERIRFARIDAWESRGKEKVLGKIATEFVKDLAPVGSWIKIQTSRDSKGKFGRYLAEVIVIGDDNVESNLNDMLLEGGHAVVYGDK